MRFPFLAGDGFYLRPLNRSDIELGYLNWLNDPEVCRYNSHHIFPYTHEAAVEFVSNLHKDRTRLVLAVCLLENDRHVGNVSLQEINLINQSAEFAILMGDRSVWGRGVSTQAGKLLLEHGFLQLNLVRIGCGTSDENIAMKKLALALGMREEGRRRSALYKNGKFVDIIEFGILREEFQR